MTCPPLTCPVCSHPLERAGRSWACAARHSYDVGRHGYVDLLPHGHGRSGRTGDSRDMIEARGRFLDAGHYEPLRDAIASHAAAATGGAGVVVLEAGCGDGYYLAAAGAAVGGACVFGFDLSPHALRAAARRCRGCTLFMNDVSHRICLPDASVDLLLDIFAPRNAAEFARVVRPGGALLVVVPGAAHLRELGALLPIGAAPDKVAAVTTLFADSFDVAGHDALEYTMSLGREGLANLLGMTPGAWHADVAREELPESAEVTAAFELLVLRRRP